jgi:sec-independent protein translocase protein TatA
MFKQLGPTELIIILAIVLLLFGGRKLPDAARGLGRSLRIFKAETRGMADDDAEAQKAAEADAAPTAGTTPGAEQRKDDQGV